MQIFFGYALTFIFFLTGCASNSGLGGKSSCNAKGKEFDSAKLCFQVQPEFPKALVSGVISGMVYVELDVDENGIAQNVRVVNSYPADIFDQAVLAAVKKWRFFPKSSNGEPVGDFGKGFVLSIYYGQKEPKTIKEWIGNMRKSLISISCSDVQLTVSCHARVHERLMLCLNSESIEEDSGLLPFNAETVATGREVFNCVLDERTP